MIHGCCLRGLARMKFNKIADRRLAALLAAQVILWLLTGCAKRPDMFFGGAVSIDLSASTGTTPLAPGAASTITATVFDQSNQGVIWTTVPLNFGILSGQTSTNQPSNYETVASITYTAPSNFATATTVTITATSVSNPNISVSLPIKVSPLTVSLEVVSSVTSVPSPASAQTLNQGDQLSLLAAVLPETGTTQPVTWTLSPADAGSLTAQEANTVTYIAPATVSSPVVASVSATSVSDPNAIANVQITVLPSGGASNVAIANVNGGPIPTQVYPNAAFTSVTVCFPGSITTCQTIPGVLIDTGSYGLRILQSAIPAVKLATFLDANGNTLQNCVSLADGSYLWGPVSPADVYIASELGSSVPIQVITSSNLLVPNGCSNGGETNLNTPQLLGANGILGIGPEPTDCTVAGVNYCDGSNQSTPPNLYYACPTQGCGTGDSPVLVSSVQQVTNPVTSFTNVAIGGADNNGVALQFPGVPGSQSSVMGSLIFGIGTQSNNQIGTSTIFDLDSNDHFTTVFNGQTLTSSFIDSGSNALYFPDSLPACSDNEFFCPSSLTNLSAQIQGATQGQSSINFSVDNADNLFSGNPGSAAFGTLAGPQGTFQSCSGGNTSCVFDWGLPFFYGRTVYEHIDACSPGIACDSTSAAYWAF